MAGTAISTSTGAEASVRCPHCGVANAAGSQFCEACGMAVPPAVPTRPRVVDKKSFAGTTVGQTLQSDELHKQARKAAGALLAVAVLQTIVIVVLAVVAQTNNSMTAMLHNPAIWVLAVIASIFWGLYFWARNQPLPAAIVGLVVYGTLVAINFVVTISEQVHSTSSSNRHVVRVDVVNIVIIAVLIRAIAAGMKHRKLLHGSST